MLCRGAYLDKSELSREWHVATGDSFIVDVQLVTDGDQVAGYVAKYIMKPGTAGVYRDADRLQEMIAALKGRRLILAFGDCHIPNEETDEPDHGWENVGRLSEILAAAARGVPEAQAILSILGVTNPCATTSKPPKPPP